MIKKVCVLIFCMIIGICSNVYAVETEHTISDGSVNVSVNLGEKYANKKLNILVFKPGRNIEEFNTGEGYDEADESLITGVLSTMLQLTTDGSGKFSFTYKPGNLLGIYKLRIGGEKIYAPIETYFTFASDEDADKILNELKKDDATKSDFADLFIKYDSDEIFSSYQILELDKTKMFSEFDSASDNVKDDIYSYLFNNRSQITDKESIKTLFNNAVYWRMITETSDFEKYVDTYKDIVGVNEEDFYKNLYSASFVTNADRTAFIKELKKASYLNETNKTEELHKLMLNTFLTCCTSYGAMEQIVTADKEYLISIGLKEELYDSDDMSKWRSLFKKKPFSDITAFVKAFNETFKPSTPPKQESSSSSSGGSAGFVILGDPSKSTVEEVEKIEKAPAVNHKVFSDISHVSWASEAIDYLSEKEIIIGSGDGKFNPDNFITRAEFSKIISKCFNYELQEAQFKDVNENDWFYQYAGAVNNAGVMHGSDGYFRPGDFITREDVAAVLYRISGENHNGSVAFDDLEDIADYALNAVSYCVKNNVINGISEKEFSPKAYATRAQAAKMIYRFLIATEGVNG